MSNGYTKEPWLYAGRLGFGHLIDPNIAVAYGGEHSDRAECGEANARLISAAPDLLKACKLLMKSVEKEAVTRSAESISGFPEGRAAIAKAEGRE